MKSNFKDKLDLTGKVALVTGGAGILGSQLAEGLASLGASVAVVDLSFDAAQAVASRVTEAYRGKHRGYACDVSSPESVKKTVDAVASDFGGIDILLNNAATKSSRLEAFLAPFEEYSPETWREVMSVNIDGMFLMAQAAGKVMLRQGRGGSIVQTSSIYGVVAPDHRIYEGSFYMGKPISSPAVYAASKAAVIGLSRYLAAYWGDKGIRVNTLTPGGVESGQNDAFNRRYSQRVPLQRMAQPSDIVSAALYLASDASSYVTGQNLIVDGGLTAW